MITTVLIIVWVLAIAAAGVWTYITGEAELNRRMQAAEMNGRKWPHVIRAIPGLKGDGDGAVKLPNPKHLATGSFALILAVLFLTQGGCSRYAAEPEPEAETAPLVAEVPDHSHPGTIPPGQTLPRIPYPDQVAPPTADRQSHPGGWYTDLSSGCLLNEKNDPYRSEPGDIGAQYFAGEVCP